MPRLHMILALFFSADGKAAVFSEPIDGILQIDGEITPEDGVRLEKEMNRVRPYRVQLNNHGGHILTAIDMAFTLRPRAIPTVVAAGEVCASACVIVLAGGVNVSISQSARNGLHEAVEFQNKDSQELEVRSEIGTRWFSPLLALLTDGNRECLDELVRSRTLSR